MSERPDLSSINSFYDILGDGDLTVQPVRNGLMSLTRGGEQLNYTEWNKGLGDLSNSERIHAGTGHSSYWSDKGVDKHLKAILCENKR
jgi:hypothetical protein